MNLGIFKQEHLDVIAEAGVSAERLTLMDRAEAAKENGLVVDLLDISADFVKMENRQSTDVLLKRLWI